MADQISVTRCLQIIRDDGLAAAAQYVVELLDPPGDATSKIPGEQLKRYLALGFTDPEPPVPTQLPADETLVVMTPNVKFEGVGGRRQGEPGSETPETAPPVEETAPVEPVEEEPHTRTKKSAKSGE